MYVRTYVRNVCDVLVARMKSRCMSALYVYMYVLMYMVRFLMVTSICVCIFVRVCVRLVVMHSCTNVYILTRAYTRGLVVFGNSRDYVHVRMHVRCKYIYTQPVVFGNSCAYVHVCMHVHCT
jgi:hypothetical protein